MKFNKNIFGKNWIPYTVATCSAVVVYMLLSHLGTFWHAIKALLGYFSPVFVGIVLAYVLDALVMFFERKVFKKISNDKRRRILSVVLSLLLILTLLTMISLSLVPQVFESIRVLVGNLGVYARELQQHFDKPVLEFGNFSLDFSTLVKYGEGILTKLTAGFQENMGRVLNTSVNIGKAFVNGVICFILAIYFLLSKESILDAIKKLMWQNIEETKYRQIVSVTRQCNRIMVRYIACDLLDGMIVGVANFIFMSVLGMPYVVLVTLVVAVSNLVPTFGPIFGGAVGAFILLLANPSHVLWFLIFTFILQSIDGYVLKPNLFGDSLGVPPLWVLIAVIVGGRMFGMWGIMLSIPFAAITDFIFRDVVWMRLSRDLDSSQATQMAAQQVVENATHQIL